jgi:hypothetical protein
MLSQLEPLGMSGCRNPVYPGALQFGLYMSTVMASLHAMQVLCMYS